MDAKYSRRLTARDRKKLRASDFGIPELREFPMPDAVHVHAAEAYFRYAAEEYKPLLAHRILVKAKRFGVKIQSEEIHEWAGKYEKGSRKNED